jgi:hypothetical protein
MPYDNPYNREIADRLMMINRRYVDNEMMTGQGYSGGGILSSIAGAVLPHIVDLISEAFTGSGYAGGEMPSAEFTTATAEKTEDLMEGGSGFAEGSFRDTGFERQIGAGMSAGVKEYNKDSKKDMSCGCGAGYAGGAKKKCASGKCSRGSGSAGGAKKKGKGYSGGGIISDLGIPIVSNIAKLIGLGKVSEAELSGKGWVEDIAKSALEFAPLLIGLGSAGGGYAGGALVPVENMKASSMAGQGKKKATANDGRKKRAEIVKKIMNEKGLSMIEASKYVKTHNLY